MLNTSRSHFAQRFIEGGGSTEQLTEKTNRPRHIPTIYDASDWRADSLTNKGWPVKNILNTLRLNAKHLLACYSTLCTQLWNSRWNMNAISCELVTMQCSDEVSRWAGWALSSQPIRNLGLPLTLFQPGGERDYAHHIIAWSPGVENLTSSLSYNVVLSLNLGDLKKK